VTHVCKEKKSGRMLGIYYIICMIVGPPIRGFRGRAPNLFIYFFFYFFFWGGGLFTNFFGWYFTFGGLVVHGISSQGFLILVKELRLYSNLDQWIRCFLDVVGSYISYCKQ
jgi:hypothetical protein